jgi:hypothetical protein
LWFLKFGELFPNILEFLFEFIHSKKLFPNFLVTTMQKEFAQKKKKRQAVTIRATGCQPTVRDGWMVGGQENTFPLGSSS